MSTELWRPHWRRPAGYVVGIPEFKEVEEGGVTYTLVHLPQLRLTSTAALYLLQGGTLKDVFTDARFGAEVRPPYLTVICTHPPDLTNESPRLRSVTLVQHSPELRPSRSLRIRLFAALLDKKLFAVA